MKNFYKESKHVRAGVVILLIVIIIYFIIRPVILNTYTKYLQTVKYRQDIEKMNQNLEAINTIKKINSDYADQITLIDKVIPAEANEKDFIKDFSILCSRNQINLLTTQFIHYLDTINFEIKLDGRYDNLPKLLNETNNLLRLTSIESIKVEAQSDAALPGTVDIVITGRLFKKAK